MSAPSRRTAAILALPLSVALAGAPASAQEAGQMPPQPVTVGASHTGSVAAGPMDGPADRHSA